MNITIFVIALSAVAAILLLTTVATLTERLQFWPPPTTTSWQSKSFWLLFRIFVIGAVALSIVDFNKADGIWRYFVGIPLLLLGFALAFQLTFGLGRRQAFGGDEGLKTDGCYRLSRNPIYVVTFFGLFGWALVVNSLYVTVVLLIWALFYVVAPFLEEPWLESRYGDAYRQYKLQTPRFVGLNSFRQIAKDNHGNESNQCT